MDWATAALPLALARAVQLTVRTQESHFPRQNSGVDLGH